MSNRGRFWLIVAIVLCVLAGLGYSRIEWVERSVDLGPDEVARRNDFLAGETFLRRHGIETETVTGMRLLDALPSVDDVVLLSASRESLSQRRREALVDWVGAGGTLIVVAHALYDDESEASDDALLDALGVYLIEPESPQGEQATQTSSTSASDDEPADPESVESGEDVESDDGEDDAESPVPQTLAELLEEVREPAACVEDPDELERISTTSAGELTLELADVHELAVDESRLEDAYFSERAQMLSLPVYDGEVIALTSVAPFRNARIHCHDHAFFLWYVASGHDKLWLLHDPDVPSLAELAWQELPVTLAGGLGLLVLAVATASLRFGVPLASEEAPRREIREHLEAATRFQYRRGDFETLFARMRVDLARRRPSDLARWAERAGVRPERIESVLEGEAPRSRREIVRQVRTMVRLKRTQ